MFTVPVCMDYFVARRFHEGRLGIPPKLPSYQQGLRWLGLAETRKDGQLPAKAEEWHAAQCSSAAFPGSFWPSITRMNASCSSSSPTALACMPTHHAGSCRPSIAGAALSPTNKGRTCSSVRTASKSIRPASGGCSQDQFERFFRSITVQRSAGRPHPARTSAWGSEYAERVGKTKDRFSGGTATRLANVPRS